MLTLFQVFRTKQKTYSTQECSISYSLSFLIYFVVINPHTGQTLALLMIELVAPDVMYNGIPWPNEEFIKVTIER